MSTAAASRTPDGFKTPLSVSVLLHCALAAAVAFSMIHSHSGDSWGGPGGSVTVGLVGNVPAIPLPHPDISTTSRVVDNSKGLYKAEPPKVEPPPPDALPIPKFQHIKPPPKYVTRPSKLLENPAPPPPNAVPYGQGGSPSIPTTSFAMGQGTTQGGLSFNGVSGGDFGSRFSWYVEAVQRRVSGNWLQSTVDPNVSVAPRVIATFTILRDGTVTNIQITQSSNNYSVDNSAVRAVKQSSPFAPLPAGYSGSNVNVEFWFDFHR
ncbi:MAG TPA: energy transducer TonB [Candidatus Acidoferrales bacterium]|nr:energy transducer TonB [Candidatus Acidoferrales bacterium]